jgi:hypothetical protein
MLPRNLFCWWSLSIECVQHHDSPPPLTMLRERFDYAPLDHPSSRTVPFSCDCASTLRGPSSSDCAPWRVRATFEFCPNRPSSPSIGRPVGSRLDWTWAHFYLIGGFPTMKLVSLGPNDLSLCTSPERRPPQVAVRFLLHGRRRRRWA